jgi:predicted nucleic acid-binding protein
VVKILDSDHCILQIASIALENSAPLVTHNRQYFERIAALVIEDWL